MLRTMLNQHPALGMPKETKFLLGAWRRRDQWGDLNEPKNKTKLINWIVTRQGSRFDATGIPAEQAIEHLKNAPPTLGSVLGAVFELYAIRRGSQRWGDKRPGYVRHINAIRSLFPDAQIVNVVRDPRAAIASMRRLGWYNGSIVEATDLWVRSVGAGVRANERLDASTIHDLRYEDLVEEPEHTIKGLIFFLNLDQAGIQAMMGYHRSDDLPTLEYHSRVATPLDKSRILGWESDLNTGEIAFIEKVTADLMNHYEYPTTKSDISAPVELLKAFETRRRNQNNQR